jgi:hypothetical protein
MTVLLSIASSNHYTDEVVTNFGNLYESLSELPLIVDMIEHLVFNLPLWISFPPAFYKSFFKTMSAKILKTIEEFPDDSHLSEAVSFTRIMYRIRVLSVEFTFNADPIRQTVEAIHNRMPDGIDKIETFREFRALYWTFAFSVSSVRFTENDAMTLIVYCVNQREPELIRESLDFFSQLIKRNSFFLDPLRDLSFDFSEFLVLAGTADSMLLFTVLEVFRQFDSCVGFKSPSFLDFTASMLQLFNFQCAIPGIHRPSGRHHFRKL